MPCYIRQTITRTARNEKLTTVNSRKYFHTPFGSWLEYSLNVIRLARDAISVPIPPILTPTRRSG